MKQFANPHLKQTSNEELEGENFLSENNHVRIVHVTSYQDGYPPENLLKSDDRAVWVTERNQKMPQSIILDIGQMISKAKFYQGFGVKCYQANSSNPKIVQLAVSKDGQSFRQLASLLLQCKHGLQLYGIDPIGPSYKYLQVSVCETYGAEYTMLGQIFMIERNPKFQVAHNPTRDSGVMAHLKTFMSEGRDNNRATIEYTSYDNLEAPLTQSYQSQFDDHQQYASSQDERHQLRSQMSENRNQQQQQQQSKHTPYFQNQGRIIPPQEPNQEELAMLQKLQSNFNTICDKLKECQLEYQEIETETGIAQASSLESPLKKVFQSNNVSSTSVQLYPQSFGTTVNKQQLQTPSGENSIIKMKLKGGNNFQSILNAPASFRQSISSTPAREDLKSEIMGECLTFCQNQIQAQLLTQPKQSNSSSSRSSLSRRNHSEPIQQPLLEDRLRLIIEEWQTHFFEDYVQPSIQNQFNQIQEQILTSINQQQHIVPHYPIPPHHQDQDQSQSYIEGATEKMLQCLDPMTPPSQDQSRQHLYQDQQITYSEEDVQDDDAQQDIRLIAQQLQQKLAIKAEKLRMLQLQRENSSNDFQMRQRQYSDSYSSSLDDDVECLENYRNSSDFDLVNRRLID